MKVSTPTYPNRVIPWAKAETLAARALHIPKSNPTKTFALVSLIFILFLVLLVNVWIHIDIIHVGYQMAQLKHQEKMLKIEKRNFMILKASILDDSKLQAMAKKKYHLKPLTREQVITIGEEK
jgi:hypothetical protein